jgi:cation transport ATPase
MKFSRQAVWAKLKTPTEFVATLIALIGLIYGIVWVLDDVVEHVHIRVAHGWWAFQFWHAWWWLLLPIVMVAGGRLCARRIFGRLLWAVGAIWLTLLAFGASMALFGGLLMSLAASFGWVIASALTLVGLLLVGFGLAITGELVYRARRRWRSIDHLAEEICWTPDWHE